MNSGSIITGRPSVGSWVLYGLGAETDNLLEAVRGTQAGEALPLELRDLLPSGERLGHRLTRHVGELRLVVECFEMRRPAGLVQIDDAFRFRREMERIDDALRLGIHRARGCRQTRVQQRIQSHQSKSRPSPSEERPPADLARELIHVSSL